VRVNEQQQGDGGHGHEEQQQPNRRDVLYVSVEIIEGKTVVKQLMRRRMRINSDISV